jgi:DNA replication protein DnaC
MPSHDAVIEELHSLGFRAKADVLSALLVHLSKSRASPEQAWEQLVALERREREGRNLARRTRLATLGSCAPLDRFDWNHPRQADRALFERLCTLDFLEAGENVLLRGPSGVGKTTLAQNLGLAALAKGYTVRFTTLAGALADLLKQESLPALDRRLRRRYCSPDLLVLDELGYLPCDSRSADLLYNIVSRRHESRSTVITTNLAFKQWGSVFPGAACVAALIDRFVQHCHVLDIDADSWRQKESLQPIPPGPPKKSRTEKSRNTDA